MIYTLILAGIAILGMFICIFKLPAIRIHHHAIDTFWMPVLLVAIVLLCLPGFDRKAYFDILFGNSSLNPLKILALFICVSILSIALDETGFFGFIASIFIDKYKASQYQLFIVLYLLISILTVFTSNDIVILTFTPFILYFSKRGHINPIPYLVMEFTAANTWSMLLSIGNPTNIYLSSVFHIAFLEYFLHMALPAICAGVSSFLILLLLFHKSLKEKIQVFDFEKTKIENKPLCIVAVCHLFLTTILLAISNYIHLEMWIICICFAASLLVFLVIYGCITGKKRYWKGTLRRAPYSLIPFVLSMFTIIMGINSYQVFDKIGEFLHTSGSFEPYLYLLSSTISCNIVNNIPMTMMYGSILNQATDLKLVYATIIGSNIGALLTPVGALAGIMWTRILKENGIKYSSLDFIKNGVIITSVLLLSTAFALIFI